MLCGGVVEGSYANACTVRWCFGLARIWRMSILITWHCKGLEIERKGKSLSAASWTWNSHLGKGARRRSLDG